MKLTSYSRWALALALPFATGTSNASFSDHGMYLPVPTTASYGGIVGVSSPNFVDVNEVITVTKFGSGAANSYWQISGTGSTAIFDSLNGSRFKSYNLGNETVKYTANFDANGRLITSFGGTALSNTLSITGSLPAGSFGNTSWGSQPNELLLSANLTDINPNNGTADRIGTFGSFAIGFNTQFTGGWATTIPGLTGGSTGESLWLAGFSSDFANLVKALDGKTKNGTLSSLFGSTKTIHGVFSVASVPVPGAVWLFGTGLMTLLASRGKGVAAKLAA